MKRILLSIGSIVFVGGLLAGGTGAYLADQGTSTGNTFASAIVNLQVDDQGYYTDSLGNLVGTTTTSWSLSNLTGKLFWDYLDVKPGDIGENTISLHINNENAWACMNVNLTSTPENGQDAPEALVDPSAGPNQGELQNYLYFTFWADDGDNVYEQGEKIFKQGYVNAIFNGTNWVLADSSSNIWGGTGPLPGATTKYIGEAWCFGSSTPNPLPQDGKGLLPGNTNGPLVRGTGITCNGAPVGNVVQSDGITADVTFSVAQAANNGSYLCSSGGGNTPPPKTYTLFSDNFNTCSRDISYGKDSSNEWSDYGRGSNSSDYQCSYSSWHGGKNDNDNKNTNPECTILDLDAGNKDKGPNHTESYVTPSINTQTYHTITLMYDRKTDDTNAPPKPVDPMTLTVQYSVDGGTTWTTVETVTGESPWTTKTVSLSPSADNKANVKIRFTFVGVSSADHAYIDNVVVTGVTP